MAPRKKKTQAVQLTPRERLLLLMIDENTDIDDDNGEIYQYFRGDDTYNLDFLVAFQKDPVRLWEVGDRERMHALVSHGLICAPVEGEYNFIVTPLGHATALACLGSRTTLPERGRKRRAEIHSQTHDCAH